MGGRRLLRALESWQLRAPCSRASGPSRAPCRSSSARRAANAEQAFYPPARREPAKKEGACSSCSTLGPISSGPAASFSWRCWCCSSSAPSSAVSHFSGSSCITSGSPGGRVAQRAERAPVSGRAHGPAVESEGDRELAIELQGASPLARRRTVARRELGGSRHVRLARGARRARRTPRGREALPERSRADRASRFRSPNRRSQCASSAIPSRCLGLRRWL